MQTLPDKIDYNKFLEIIGIQIDKYEFKNINVILIPSIRGKFEISNQKYGLNKLEKVMSEFNQNEEKILFY